MNTSSEHRRPILVDTDLSFDDYVALLYLLQHPAVDIRAVTVVNGVVHVQPGVENARRVLALAGRREIPVAGGPSAPLSGARTFPSRWRTLLDYVPRLFLPRIPATASVLSAPELICQQCLASDHPMTFVALGPLTNLALALRAEPNLAGCIETIFISGGALYVAGLIHEDLPNHSNMVAEWNFYLDPEAAEVVFQAGIPIVMIPLDVTHVSGPHPLLFSRNFVRQLRASAQGKAMRVMVRLISIWQLATPQFSNTPVWDGVAAALLTTPEIGMEWREVSIRVMTHPDEVAGQTFVEGDQLPNVRVCLGGDQEALEKAYLEVARRELKKNG